MIPEPRFVNLPKHFWANIRTISQRSATPYAAEQGKSSFRPWIRSGNVWNGWACRPAT